MAHFSGRQGGQGRSKNLEDFVGKWDAKVPANLQTAFMVHSHSSTLTSGSCKPGVLNQELNCTPGGHVATSGDIFWLSQMKRWEGDATGI